MPWSIPGLGRFCYPPLAAGLQACPERSRRAFSPTAPLCGSAERGRARTLIAAFVPTGLSSPFPAGGKAPRACLRQMTGLGAQQRH